MLANLRLTSLILLFALFAASFSLAQERPDASVWQSLADYAEELIAERSTDEEILEQVRADLVDWRERFLAAQGANAERIARLRGQIQALGPLPNPDNGDLPDSEEVAARRAELTAELAQVRAPIIAAEESYREADGLIRAIDNQIRARRADRVLELGPSPLDPTHWGHAAEQLASVGRELLREAGSVFSTDSKWRAFVNSLPLVLVLTVSGLFLIIRAPRWVGLVVARLRQRTREGSGVWSFLVSLGEIALPLIGLELLLRAVQISGVTGPFLSQLIDSLTFWGAIIIVAWWLGEQVFSREDSVAIAPLEGGKRREARYHAGILGLTYVAQDFVVTLSEAASLAPGTRTVLLFPIIVVAAISLFRMGRLLMSLPKPVPNADGEVEAGFARRMIRLAGRACFIVSLAGPVMVLIGYGAAGTELIFPVISSLFLLGCVTVLQRVVFDIYYLITGARGVEQRGLIPVLVGFAITLASLPLLALIWGAREEDLSELWAQFQEGVQLGEGRVSPSDFLTFVVVFAIGYMLTRLIQSGLRTSVLPKTRLDAGGQTAILSGISYVGIFLAGLLAITSAGIDLTALGYVAGALSVGIGFGLQNIVSNFVSGIILLIERPISKGDWIEVGGQMGYVRDISVRATRIETFDRTDVIVPNSDFISGTVTNFTRGNTIGRVIAPVGVAYGTDTKRVEKILMEIAEAHPMVLATPPPSIVFRGFGADSLDFEIRAILRDVNWVLSVHSDLNHEIARRFTEEGIEIPFAQRDLWLRNPEALRQPDSNEGQGT